MEKLLVSSSPHFRTPLTTQKIMGGVLLSLLPAIVAGSVIFGIRALLVVCFCMASCVILEFICRFVMKREQTVFDLSAAVTGALLGLTLPANINLALAFVGCVAAIVVIKQCFGGLGQNFINPAIGARVVMMVSFPAQMTTWVYDGVTQATPLASAESSLSYLDMFFGKMPGCIGETCTLALLIGGLFLIVTRIIKPIIPVFFISTAALFSLIVGEDPLFQVLSGGIVLGAFFMATDYVTSPVTDIGKIVFAVGCGIITMVIRLYGNMPEGVSFGILIMNILTPHIDRLCRPKAFGYVKPPKKVTGGGKK